MMRWAPFFFLFQVACGAGEKPDTGTHDADGDGYDIWSDCDDGDATVHPGAEEVCDDKDNDCDGQVDELVQIDTYPDADGDGYGVDQGAVQAMPLAELPSRREVGLVEHDLAQRYGCGAL